MRTDLTRTTCAYCGVGCGVLVKQRSPRQVELAGDPEHPANFGRLCSKGSLLGDTLGLERRLLYPELHGGRVPWPDALEHVASGLQSIIHRHGPDAVALYVSGQMLTEDYYVANKFMKGFLGSANIDTNSRLCMSSSVAAHQRAFGSDTVPVCYEDLESADLLVITGSNFSWCHPVLSQRVREAKARRMIRVVLIDPRKTETAELADIHLALKPATDAILFNGLLTYLRQNDRLDFDFLEKHTRGFSEALSAAKPYSIPLVSRLCELDEENVVRFFSLFARSEKTVTLYAQGIHQSTSGTDKINSIINCHLATGRIGRPGMGPFSLTGQGNAMGGREVGGMSTQLAAHMGFGSPTNISIVQEFWQSPGIATRPGLKAVDIFNSIREGAVKALWIIATNPMVSLPDAASVREALTGCELLIVSECTRETDTTAFAHVLLPAAAWGEKDGTVTNSERCISR